MLYSIVAFAMFFAIMAAWRFVVVTTFYDFGIIGSLALLAATLGAAFWIDYKWPQPRHDPPGTSVATVRKLDMGAHVNTAVILLFLVVFFTLLLTLPTDWLFYWLIPLAVVYVRWTVVVMRREKRLLGEAAVAPHGESLPNNVPLLSGGRSRLGTK